MDQFRQSYTVRLMCRVLEVSASGYYRWRQRPASLREKRRAVTEAAIMETYASFKARYGAPRIAQELSATGVPCSVNYVAGIMREKAIRARNGKAFKYSRTSEAMTNVAENLLWRQFAASVCSVGSKPEVDDRHYLHMGEWPLALFGDGDGLVLAPYCWLVAGYEHDRATDYRCPEHGLWTPRGEPRADCAFGSWCSVSVDRLPGLPAFKGLCTEHEP